MSKHKIGILGTGSYLPEAVLTNQHLEKMVDTTDDWIVERSGDSRASHRRPGRRCGHHGGDRRPPGPGGRRHRRRSS